MKPPYRGRFAASTPETRSDADAAAVVKARFGAGHVAWLAMACSILIWGTTELRAGQLANTGNWYRITLVLVAAATCAFGLLRNAGRLSRAFGGPLILLLVYGVIGMVSALYIPRYSLYSMWKASEFVIDVLAIGIVIGSVAPRPSARLAYDIMLGLFATLVFVYWAEALIVPAAAFVPSRGLIPFTLQGVLPIMNGNAVAFVSAVVAFIAWCRMLGRRGAARAGWSLVLAFAFGMLILAQSRTSLVGFFVAVAVQLLFARRFGLFALAGVVAMLVVATGVGNVAERFFVRGQSPELFSSLSGRTLAWQAAWEAFLESPVLGHGFAAAARADILGATGASTLHGAVFDVLVGVGLLGLVPWAAAIAWTSLRLLRLGIGAARVRRDGDAVDRGTIAEMLGVLALIIVRSTTSSGLALHEHEFMMFCTVLAFTMTAVPSRRGARVAAPGARPPQYQAVRSDARPGAKRPLRPTAPAARRRSV